MVGRHRIRSNGPRSTNLDHQYSTWVCPFPIDDASLRTGRSVGQRPGRQIGSGRRSHFTTRRFRPPCKDGARW
jgi:hypothetical protein